MPEEIIGGLRTVLAGGTDRAGGGDGPLVCLLHGYGASGDDLAGLWRVLDVPRGVRFAFPEAHQSLRHLFGFPSYAWWPVDVERYQRAVLDADDDLALSAVLQGLMDEEPQGLREARDRVLAWLAALRERLGGVPAHRLVLGGFSQGAMLATDVALHLPPEEPLGGLVLLSGALVNRPRWEARLAGAPRTPRFQSHGLEDPILPFAMGQALHELLEPVWPGTFYRFHGGHEISPGALEALGEALTGWLGG